MFKHQDLAQGSELPPHPLLTRYYGASEASRRRWLDGMFDGAAAHYDTVTAMMSFGSGQWYRRGALQRYGLSSGMSLLDVGCGTGALAVSGTVIIGAAGRAVALDPSAGMLAKARQAGVELVVRGVGDRLPFRDDTFDMLAMGYALRHVEDLRACFREYLRVVKPGGRVLLLEITKPDSRALRWALRQYLRYVVPVAAQLVSGSRMTQELMRYFWDTIEHCVPPEVIAAALVDAGFKTSGHKVTLRIFSEYTAIKAA